MISLVTWVDEVYDQTSPSAKKERKKKENQGQGPRVVQQSDPFHPVPTQSEIRTSIYRIWATAALYCTQTAWDPV